MEQTVYADLLFLINFSMDFLCLFLVARLLAAPFSFLRGGLAAAVGGAYAVALLFVDLGILGWVMDLLTCFLICTIAYAARGQGLRGLLLYTAAFFLVSMLLGGIMTSLFNLMNRAAPPLDEFTESYDLPVWLFAAVTILAATATRIGGRFLRRRAQVQEAQIEIRMAEQSVTVQGFCDSGNLLRDAVSGKSVIVLDLTVARHLMPELHRLSDLSRSDALPSLPSHLAARARLIPTQTANAESLMPAFRPDSIVIYTEKQRRSVEALIGFADLSHAPPPCHAILPPELIL